MNTNLLNNKSAIRILIYTDDPNGITLGLAPGNDLGIMRKLLLAHAPVFAKVEVDLIARDSDQATKLSLDFYIGMTRCGSLEFITSVRKSAYSLSTRKTCSKLG